MATISNTPRPGYVWDSTDNVWYPIGTGPHTHADYITSGSAINPTIVDAKGDIIAATAADTVARLAVGANDTVLTADSSTATGLKWAAVAASPASASATVATEQDTTSGGYTDLVTSGPAVTLTTGTKALVIITAQQFNSTANQQFASFAVSGATTIAASDARAVRHQNGSYEELRFSAASRLTTLNAGSNTFTMKYRIAGGTGYFSNREIIVIDLGS